jgi:DNA-binding NarL/FixJ family response regulator
MPSYQILLADDQAFLRKGLVSVLEQDREFFVAGEAGDGLEVLDLLNQGIVPDVLILDLSMPKMSGIEVLRRIREMALTFKILVLTMHKEPEILCQTCSSGADGYMLKDAMGKELLPAIHALLKDRIYLSPLMAKELPDTCWMKTAAQQCLPSSTAKHCEKLIRAHNEANFSSPS